jgi:hypothetical protein
MKFLLFLTMIFLTSCSVTVPDVPVCSQLAVNEGFCVNTYSGKSQVVNDVSLMGGETWWDIKSKSLYLPAKSWAKIKLFIIQICAKTKRCSKEVGSWDRTVEVIDEMVKK